MKIPAWCEAPYRRACEIVEADADMHAPDAMALTAKLAIEALGAEEEELLACAKALQELNVSTAKPRRHQDSIRAALSGPIVQRLLK